MEDTTCVDPFNEMYSLSVHINNLFLEPSKSSNQNKWSLLKEYYTKHLRRDNMSAMLFSSYHSITFTLLDALKPTLFSEKWQEKLFDDIFLHGIYHEAFMILVRKLDASCESYQQQKILNLLEKFLQGKSIDSLVLHQCLSRGTWDPEYISVSKTWDDLITFIVSLPERVANKTKGQMHKIFHTNYYVPLLTSCMLKVLSSLHQKITESQNCTLEFIGKLIGKFCVLGRADTITQRFTMVLIQHSEADLVWRKICQNLITKMPSSSLEPFVTHLLLVVPWYGYVDWILGDEGVKNKKLHYILTTKLLLMRHFKKEAILQNAIGYFASSSSRKSHFWMILNSLLKTWSDESALKHLGFEQQKYLASALVVCAGWIKELNDVSQGKAYVDKALQGTSIRIGNSEECVRSLGMIVGGLLMTSLDPTGPKFEYEEVVDAKVIQEFKSLLVIPGNPGRESLYTEGLNCFEEVESENCGNKSEKTEKINSDQLDRNLELDSDDDLEPYDMSGDMPQSQVKRPFYLNDCLQGLMEQEKDADWFEQCLKYAESLIEANSESMHEIAVEMTKIMLHLEDTYSTQDFSTLRHRILVSLTVHAPILVAEYLTSQFYERDYNIKQRLDILEVLEHSSRELSKPKEAPSVTQVWHSKEKFTESTERTWKSIVEQRIAAKTRYISKTPKKSLPELLENRLSPVAGYFFFPLLAKYDKQNTMLKLFGEDSYVLGRLIYTLGIVMHSASNIPSSQRMGEALLQFLVDVRNHADVFVRQASILATAAVYTSVPSFLLFSDEMVSHVIESQLWLQSIVDKDPDTNCQIRANYALSCIVGLMRKEMPVVSAILSS